MKLFENKKKREKRTDDTVTPLPPKKNPRTEARGKMDDTHLKGTEKLGVKKKKRLSFLGFDIDFFSGAMTQLVALVLSVLTVAYFGYHLYSAFSESVSTVQVHTITEELTCSGTAVYIRDEKVLTTTATGSAAALLDDGERVAKNEVAVGIYSKDMTGVRESLAQTEKEISLITAAMGTGASALGLSDSFSALSDEYTALMQYAATGNWTAYSAESDTLRELMNRCSYISGDGKALEDRLDDLKTDRTELQTKLSSYKSSVEAPVQGYYYSFADGYETYITTELLNGFSEETYRKMLSYSPDIPDGCVGKIALNTSWYLAVEIPGTYVQDVTSDDTVTVSFGIEGTESHEMAVESSVRTDTGFILLLSCTDPAVEELRNRIQNVTVKYDEITGYRIPTSALHTCDGFTGVYTLHGKNIRFRQTEIIYDGNGYCIVTPYEEIEAEETTTYRYIAYGYTCPIDEVHGYISYAVENHLDRLCDLHDGTLAGGTDSINAVLFLDKLARGEAMRYGETDVSYDYLDDLESVIVAGRDLYDGKVTD